MIEDFKYLIYKKKYQIKNWGIYVSIIFVIFVNL